MKMVVRGIVSLALLMCVVVGVPGPQLHAQVSSDRLSRADAEPQNWLTYNGTYDSQATVDSTRSRRRMWPISN